MDRGNVSFEDLFGMAQNGFSN